MESSFSEAEPSKNIENSPELVSCLFCTNIVPLKTNKRVRNFNTKITLFCHALSLPQDTFEHGFKYSPLCNDCMEIILSVASMQRSLEELEVKLNLKKETIVRLFKLEYKLDHEEEVRLFKKFSPTKFRERIQERLGILPQSQENEQLVTNLAQTVYSPGNSPRVLETENLDDAPPEPEDPKPTSFSEKAVPEEGAVKIPVTKKKKDRRKVGVKSVQRKLLGTKTVEIKKRLSNSKEKRINEGKLEVLKKREEKMKRQAENDSKLVVKCTFVDEVKGPCRYRFVNEEKMDIHIRRHHLNLPKNEMYQCPHCPRTASCESKLELHMKLHTGKTDLPCEICDLRFRTEYLVTKHKVKVHGISYPFVCSECSEGFINKADLNYHNYSHTGDWPYPCDECNAGFPSKARLDRHKQHNHYDLKVLNFACRVCDKKFQSVGVLNRHEKSHEAERPFKCNICSWSFKFNSLLKTHMISVHSEDRPFLCQECGAAFKLNKQLLVHLRGHDHRKRPFLKRTRRLRSPIPGPEVPIHNSAPSSVKSIAQEMADNRTDPNSTPPKNRSSSSEQSSYELALSLLGGS